MPLAVSGGRFASIFRLLIDCRDVDLREAEPGRDVHRGDDRLMGGARIGADRDRLRGCALAARRSAVARVSRWLFTSACSLTR